MKDWNVIPTIARIFGRVKYKKNMMNLEEQYGFRSCTYNMF